MVESYMIIFSAIGCAIIAEGWRTTRKKANGMALPPGPRLLPFLGNILDIDVARPWLTYAEWGKQYGDIVYSRLFGQHFIIVNSEKVARTIVDKHSAIYSDRPVIATNEYFGFSFNTGLLPYGDTFRMHRKLFHQVLRVEASNSYQDLYLRKAHELVVNLFDAPEEVERHLNTFAASLILAVTYGYETQPMDDPFVTSVQKVISIGNQIISPERAAMQMFFPFLTRLPSFVPGGEYKKQAPECRRLVQDMMETPFEYVKKQLAKGTARQSMVSDFLNQGNGSQFRAHEQLMKAVAATAYLGGSETTSSTLHTFLLAMVLYPEVQALARAAIDAVCGRDGIPTFQDRESLPYIEAVCRELLRWAPVAPLCIPHATSCDDVYNGFLIPKGSVVVLNAWAMGHDEDIYPNPSHFDPDRHLTTDGKLKDEPMCSHFAFGFGRRICPGRFFADHSLWASVVSILSTIEIAKAQDKDGKDIDFTPRFTNGLTIHPEHFPCSMRSVSSAREEQMRTMWRVDATGQ
ncbi:cytochrome P450 [Suillus paluster]|uniref:cytochrome P450 n=1 Tax=Suillus paluster TaxID=48578 RepID=UPI001B86E002|nr:cytochrome P450 [Suillus paluster]KAG1730688.1 cytochrome P450 [Suillus paluster]